MIIKYGYCFLPLRAGKTVFCSYGPSVKLADGDT